MAGAKVKRARLNMRVPEGLLRWAKGYAVAKNKSLTQLLIDYMTDLKEKADASNNHEALEPRGRAPSRVQARP